jgi:hypothetical protein
MILLNRKFDYSQAFIQSILAKLISMMLQGSSIQWDRIYDVIEKYQEALEFFSLVNETGYCEEALVTELSNSLLSADEPLVYVETALLLIGCSEASSIANEIAQTIADGDMDYSDDFARYLVALGFPHTYNLNQLSENFVNDMIVALRSDKLRLDEL